MRIGDRVVWLGERMTEGKRKSALPAGSSGKLREAKLDDDGDPWLFVDWGGGFEGWYPADAISSTTKAGEMGIEPWATS